MRDSFGREINYLRLSVTELCNLRCRYCMPEGGVCKKEHGEMLTEEEIVLAVRTAAELGITKLRITGGEPLIKKNIVSICEKTARIPGIREVCITTNGTLLPQLAEPLRRAGVSRLNISLDTLDADKFRYITRVGSLREVLDGIEAALTAGYEKIKLNAVLIGGFNDDEIPALAALTEKWPVDLRFIEMMPMYDGGDFSAGSFIPSSTVLEKLPQLQAEERDGGVATLYRLPGAQGRIGLISPLSCHFCGECNRIRLTADGKLKPCLHGKEEFSIKGLDAAGMRGQFEKAILSKPEWHGELSFDHRSQSGRNMNRIGG